MSIRQAKIESWATFMRGLTSFLECSQGKITQYAGDEAHG